MQYQIDVPSQLVSRVFSLIEKTNRQARKFGTSEATYSVVEEYERKIEIDPGVFHRVPYTKLEIEGIESPSYAGYQFVGKITNDDGVVLFTSLPNEEIPSVYRNNPQFNWCDHCHTKHHRKHLMIVRNKESGEYMQVGKACVKDFTGHPNALQSINGLLAFLAKLDEFDQIEGEQFAGVATRVAPLVDVVAHSIRQIEVYGWVSRQAEPGSGPSTADEVEKMITARNRKQIDVEYVNKAENVIQWVRDILANKPADQLTDYHHNLVNLFEDDEVRFKHFGIVCSAYLAYTKAMEAEYEDNTKPSEWVGEKKQRLNMRVQLVFKTTVEGYYGLTHIHKFEDEDGNVFVWFGTRAIDAEQGDWIDIRATVKDHSTYKDVKQTVLTRVQT